MTHVTCMLTAKNRDQLRNPTLGNRVWATFTFFICRSESYSFSASTRLRYFRAVRTTFRLAQQRRVLAANWLTEPIKNRSPASDDLLRTGCDEAGICGRWGTRLSWGSGWSVHQSSESDGPVDISQRNLAPTARNRQLKSGKQKNSEVKTDMLRSIGKQSGESVESVLKKIRTATVGRTCWKRRF